MVGRAVAGFSNRRQIGAYAGFAPTPWRSASIAHEQALARKLLVALWKYVNFGEVIEGAVMTAAA